MGSAGRKVRFMSPRPRVLEKRVIVAVTVSPATVEVLDGIVAGRKRARRRDANRSQVMEDAVLAYGGSYVEQGGAVATVKESLMVERCCALMIEPGGKGSHCGKPATELCDGCLPYCKHHADLRKSQKYGPWTVITPNSAGKGPR
jgi:hypothetical protein